MIHNSKTTAEQHLDTWGQPGIQTDKQSDNQTSVRQLDGQTDTLTDRQTNSQGGTQTNHIFFVRITIELRSTWGEVNHVPMPGDAMRGR